MDVLKREISRVSNQVKRMFHRLEDAISSVEKNVMHLQTNSVGVIEEIDDLYRYRILSSFSSGSVDCFPNFP